MKLLSIISGVLMHGTVGKMTLLQADSFWFGTMQMQEKANTSGGKG